MTDREQLDLAKSIARHPYAWPGGYVRALVLEDGGTLCPKCVRSEYRQIVSDVRNGFDTGWTPTGQFSTAEVAEVDWCEDGENCKRCDDGETGHWVTCDHCDAEMCTW